MSSSLYKKDAIYQDVLYLALSCLVGHRFIHEYCITKVKTAGRKPEILATIRGKLKALMTAEGQEVVWSMCGSSSQNTYPLRKVVSKDPWQNWRKVEPLDLRLKSHSYERENLSHYISACLYIQECIFTLLLLNSCFQNKWDESFQPGCVPLGLTACLQEGLVYKERTLIESHIATSQTPT